MIFWAIGILVAVGFIRTISFAVWNFKDKNIVGGLALLILSLISSLACIFNLLT